MSNNIGFKGVIRTSYMDSTPYWPEEKKAPENAPNVIYIILDDTGYAQLGCYGSAVETPNIDSIADEGLRYRDFHVNAMCSPTRASLLTGCNHHTVGLGYLSNWNLGFPSVSGNIDPKYGYISETLLENGYSTFAVGKWHLCNQKDMTNAGPHHQWPLGRGFEKYYGFLNAATSQFHPTLVHDNHCVDPPNLPEEDYHLSEDLVDHAIGYIGDQKSNFPEKPFFCYLAFGAMHGPHHSPEGYMEKYKGFFDAGWDEYRKSVFKKQKELGLIPEDTVLTDRNDMAPVWDRLSPRHQKVFAKYMEAFAGFMTHTDDQIGRLIDYLKKIGQYDNTILVLLSDNGASGEGGPNGSFSELYHLISMKFPELCTDEEYDLIGTPEANNNYPPGWAWAGNTPLKWYKTWVHAGGVKVPLIIRYPKKIKDKGAIRDQYHHVIDINTTILEVTGATQPESIKGVKQETKHGVSMAYSFERPKAPTTRHIQYYEMLGNRGIWADGWKAVANHVVSDSFDKDQWELYHTAIDFSESNDLSQAHPEKLRELVDLWWNQAGEYGVLPLLESYYKKKDGFNFNHMLKFPPANPATRQVIYPEIAPGGSTISTTNRSFTVTTFIEHQTDADGVILSSGANVHGYVLYIDGNRPKFHFNHLRESCHNIEAPEDLTPGYHAITIDLKLLSPGEGECRLIVDEKSGPATVIKCMPLFASSRGVALGRYLTSPVYSQHKDKGYFKYTGIIEKAVFNTERPDNDHDLMLELQEEERIA